MEKNPRKIKQRKQTHSVTWYIVKKVLILDMNNILQCYCTSVDSTWTSFLAQLIRSWAHFLKFALCSALLFCFFINERISRQLASLSTVTNKIAVYLVSMRVKWRGKRPVLPLPRETSRLTNFQSVVNIRSRKMVFTSRIKVMRAGWSEPCNQILKPEMFSLNSPVFLEKKIIRKAQLKTARKVQRFILHTFSWEPCLFSTSKI